TQAMTRNGLQKELSVLPVHLVNDPDESVIANFFAHAKDMPDGILAASDVIAMSTLRTLSELGLSVPASIKVIGYDGLALGEQTVPRLSTVRQDLTTGAHNLVDLLLRRIAGEDTGSVVMPPKLLVRLSS
ncbi:MAG: substrate-binding domain-containing protein, partial [Sphingorhabdus sp.]